MNTRQLILFSAILLCACKSSIREKEDKIYSRHLQRHVNLTVITTPMPSDKSDMNLLLYLNGQDFEEMALKSIVDSLYKENSIQPITIVGIHGNKEEYGMTDFTGKAGQFNQFVIKELSPFIRKKTGVRKFRSVAIWGASQQGIGALDIAWQHADKIDKVGVFEGDFGYAGKNDSTEMVIENLRRSRKRPRLEYWFYAAESDTANLRAASTLVQVINQKNISNKADIHLFVDTTGLNRSRILQKRFAEFLSAAFGK